MSEHVSRIESKFGDKVISTKEFRGEHAVIVALDALHSVLAFCKDELGYNFLVDICSVDHETVHPRFEMVYELAYVDNSHHLRIKAPVAEDEQVESVVDLWKTADWHEREVYDMMGIKFLNHPNLTRILMWEGYPYFPLRKEFPLAGKPTEMPDVANTGVAPMEGGPFVTSSSAKSTVAGEPRAKGES